MDRSFVDLNRQSTQRIKDMVAQLSDEQMLQPVGEHWTVAIVMAHLAFWDRRVMYVLDRTEKEGKVYPPQIEIATNDISLPLWAAIPPREAARLAIENAEALDRRLEGFPPALLEEVFNYNQRFVIRALHRNEHLDEV
jgi:uncharacterized damage-inducible protein DinB